MAITIADTNTEGDPVTIDYTLPARLEDPSLRWLLWDGSRYVPFTPPAPGATVSLVQNRYRPAPAPV